MRKPVKHVEVMYEDGTTETFRNVGGYYKTTMNSMPRNMKESDGWLDHEIRWTDRKRVDQ